MPNIFRTVKFILIIGIHIQCNDGKAPFKAQIYWEKDDLIILAIEIK